MTLSAAPSGAHFVLSTPVSVVLPLLGEKTAVLTPIPPLVLVRSGLAPIMRPERLMSSLTLAWYRGHHRRARTRIVSDAERLSCRLRICEDYRWTFDLEAMKSITPRVNLIGTSSRLLLCTYCSLTCTCLAFSLASSTCPLNSSSLSCISSFFRLHFSFEDLCLALSSASWYFNADIVEFVASSTTGR